MRRVISFIVRLYTGLKHRLDMSMRLMLVLLHLLGVIKLRLFLFEIDLESFTLPSA